MPAKKTTKKTTNNKNTKKAVAKKTTTKKTTTKKVAPKNCQQTQRIRTSMEQHRYQLFQLPAAYAAASTQPQLAKNRSLL